MAENQLMRAGGGADASIYAGYGEQPNALLQIGQMQQIDNARTANQIQQHQLARQQVDSIKGVLAPLLANPNATREDYIGAAGQAVALKLATPDQATTLIRSMPSDPASLRQFGQRMMLDVVSAEKRMDEILGKPDTLGLGDVAIDRNVNRLTGAVTPMAGASSNAIGMSPESKAQRVQTVGPQGQPMTVPQSAVTGRTGFALPAPQASAPGTGAGGSMAPSGLGGQPNRNPGPQAQGLPRGALPTGQAPGVAEAAVETGKRSGVELAGERTAVGDFQRATYPLRKAITALEELGTTGTGPGTETVNQVKSFLQSAGVPGLDASKIQNFDEAKKYLVEDINRNGNAGTNDKLAASFAGAPSVNISNAAAVDVAKSALTLRRMQAAKVREFEKTGLPDSEFSKWSGGFNAEQDARAYGFDLMSGAAQKKMLAGMSDAEKAKFVKSLGTAHANTLIERPNGR